MTYLQLINAVLRRLRESEVSSWDETAYSKLIGDFVNEAKREVEDAWNWMQLRSSIQVTCSPNVFSYALTGAGNRYRVLQVINDTQDYDMRGVPYKHLNRLFVVTDTVETGNPLYYGINGMTGDDPNVDVWPVPSAADVLLFHMVIPQADLDANADTLTVPSWPVILGAFAKALSERGEDGSTMFAEAYGSYSHALSDAIALDAYNQSDELDWVVC